MSGSGVRTRGLAHLRTAAARYRTTSVNIVTTPLVDDGLGGKTNGTPTTVAVDAQIRSLGSSADERAIAERLAGKSLWVIAVAVGTTITSKDTITEPSTGRVFQVVKPMVDSIAAELQIVCIEE